MRQVLIRQEMNGCLNISGLVCIIRTINNIHSFIKHIKQIQSSKRQQNKSITHRRADHPFQSHNFQTMKGSISLNPKYQSLYIKPTRILKTNPLIACDQRHLYFKPTNPLDAPAKCIRWQDKPVINCTYLRKYNIILFLCENYRVYAMTENLQEISSMTGWQSKYTLAFEYIEEFGLLLLIGAESVEVLRIQIDTNVKKTKFISSIKFNLKKITSQPTALNSSLSWNKGYNYNILEDLLYVWSPQSIAFFQMSTYELLSQSHSLTKKEHPITCCYFSPYFKYTLTGTSCGQIRVWRLPLSQRFQHENVLIHVFEAHTKTIKQIVESKYSQKIILTSGEDLLVCVWSLETFEMLRKFEFFGVYGEVFVKSIDEAFVTKDGVLGCLNFGQSLEFITEINSNILMVDKQFLHTSNGIAQPQLNAVSLTLEQNLGMVFDSSLLLRAKELNKMQTKNIYPPLKAKSIKQIISSPFSATTYFLLAQNGELFRVLVPPFNKQSIGSSSKIQEVYNIEFVMDKQKHPFNQRPTIIGFLDVLPTQFDSEIRDVDDSGGKSFRAASQEKGLSFSDALEKYYQLKLMAIGCEKGSVIFLSNTDMTKIYCRLTYHRDRITMIQSVKEFSVPDFNPMNGLVATYCAQHYLKLIKFDYQKSSANCIITYYAGQQLKMLRGFDNLMVVVFYKGEFEITQVDYKGKSEEFCCRRSNNVESHEGEILSVDYERQSEMILTAASDNRIKLWTNKKILLYDVVLDQGLAYAFFVPHPVIVKNQEQIVEKKMITPSQNDEKDKEKQHSQSSKSVQQKKPLQPLNPLDAKIKQLMKRPRPQPVNFDMIILHGQKLLYFHHIPLSFRTNEISDYNSNPQLLDDQNITLREVFQSYNQKMIQAQENDLVVSTEKHIQSKIPPINHQRQRIKTEPSHKFSEPKKFFGQASRIVGQDNNNDSYLNSPLQHKGKLKTQASIQANHNNPHLYHAQQYQQSNQTQFRISTQKKRQKTLTQKSDSKSKYKSQIQKPPLVSQSSIEATKRHLQQLQSLKQQINSNHPFLPKIRNKKEDIFDQFMREKLINKNVLTRRDITINRIIMKNIIRQHFAEESKIAGLRLQY